MNKELVTILDTLSNKTGICRNDLTLCEFLELVAEKIPTKDIWQILPGETFIFNGKRYMCKESVNDICNECDMHRDGSTICQLIHHQEDHEDLHCSSDKRNDGKNVIYVEVN